MRNHRETMTKIAENTSASAVYTINVVILLILISKMFIEWNIDLNLVRACIICISILIFQYLYYKYEGDNK